MTRFRYVMVTAVAVLGIAIAAVVPTAPRLLWNASASVPIGFYTVVPTDRIEVPDLVAVIPPEPFASFIVERSYVARDVPLLKRVLGLPGQRVCRAGHAIAVDAVPLGEAHLRDSRGRDLPVCRVIVNQAHCFATGGAFDNGLPFSLSMGCGSWGGNSIDANLNWRHFMQRTRVVRPIPPREPALDEIFGSYWQEAGK